MTSRRTRRRHQHDQTRVNAANADVDLPQQIRDLALFGCPDRPSPNSNLVRANSTHRHSNPVQPVRAEVDERELHACDQPGRSVCGRRNVERVPDCEGSTHAQQRANQRRGDWETGTELKRVSNLECKLAVGDLVVHVASMA